MVAGLADRSRALSTVARLAYRNGYGTRQSERRYTSMVNGASVGALAYVNNYE